MGARMRNFYSQQSGIRMMKMEKTKKKIFTPNENHFVRIKLAVNSARLCKLARITSVHRLMRKKVLQTQ